MNIEWFAELTKDYPAEDIERTREIVKKALRAGITDIVNDHGGKYGYYGLSGRYHGKYIKMPDFDSSLVSITLDEAVCGMTLDMLAEKLPALSKERIEEVIWDCQPRTIKCIHNTPPYNEIILFFPEGTTFTL